jgi:hypothetical protein
MVATGDPDKSSSQLWRGCESWMGLFWREQCLKKLHFTWHLSSGEAFLKMGDLEDVYKLLVVSQYRRRHC